MKLITVIASFFLLAFYSNAQNLSRSEKREWKIALKNMEETDQLYRKLMVNSPEMNNDSIWKLQTAFDSINKVKFVELTTRYGYPSQKNIGKEASIALILHFTNPSDFDALIDLFKDELEKGRMLPEYYAWWYDRCQRNMNAPIYFGQYTNQKEFCGEEWFTYNERRKAIGLEPLPGKARCE